MAVLLGLWGFSNLQSGGENVECGDKAMNAGDTCITIVNGSPTSRNAEEQASEDHRSGWIKIGIAGLIGTIGVACVFGALRD
ncbi:hypothetical protein [Microtetraspora malaysiensis]|uniref:hypothetical protein n=1 Tax=Microtetraspora malaysiensis TaxID=161358 RepID=UPI003D92B098